MRPKTKKAKIGKIALQMLLLRMDLMAMSGLMSGDFEPHVSVIPGLTGIGDGFGGPGPCTAQ